MTLFLCWQSSIYTNAQFSGHRLEVRMNLMLDHLIITVNDLDTAITSYRENGFRVHYGGQHIGGGTHNALIVFADGTNLELLAKTRPDAITPYDTWFANGEGCAGFALGVDDIQACHDTLQQQGVPVQLIRDGGRTRADGVPLQWRVMPIGEASFPFLIEDVTLRNLRVPVDDPDWVAHPNLSIGIASVTAQFDRPQLRVLNILLGLNDTESQNQNNTVAFQLGKTRFLLIESVEAQTSKPEYMLSYSVE